MASSPTKAEIAVAHVLRAIRDDGRKAYLFGLGSQSFTLLTDAYAEANGIEPKQFREEFWSQCSPVKVTDASRSVTPEGFADELTLRLQERNRFIDMPTMRAIVDEAINAMRRA